MIEKLKDLHWYNNITELFMSRGYFNKDKDISQTISDMAQHSANILGKGKDYKDKLESYLRKGIYVVPTPVWKNMNSTSKESVISCFGTYIDDTVESIVLKASEVALQNRIGGGTSGVFSHIRPRGAKIGNGGKSNGSVSMMQIYQTISKIISQPNRRGHFSATLDIEHDDFDEFIGAMRDEHPLQTISIGVAISDKFMNSFIGGDRDAYNRMQKLVKARFETGFPYIFFTDTVNRDTVDVYKDKGMKIHHSNMCQEITLPNSPEESFVCCLLGMNAELYDYWKDTDAVEIGVYFMDSMLQDFLNKMELKKKQNEENYNILYKAAVTFVENHRAVGLGQSGLHGYLQSKMIPFHSLQGRSISTLIQKTIQNQAWRASEKMAQEYGKANVLKEDKYKRRHTVLTAIAPNTSSAFIIDQQPQSIEVIVSNFYVKDVVNAKIEIKNKHLEKLLDKKGKNNRKVWQSILSKDGSVQHLDFLTQEEKDVFKTFSEIPQDFILEVASARQKFIDQSQSLNLMIGKDVDPSYVVYLILKAWKIGIKTLYYQLNVSQAQEFTKDRECVACAG